MSRPQSPIVGRSRVSHSADVGRSPSVPAHATQEIRTATDKERTMKPRFALYTAPVALAVLFSAPAGAQADRDTRTGSQYYQDRYVDDGSHDDWYYTNPNRSTLRSDLDRRDVRRFDERQSFSSPSQRSATDLRDYDYRYDTRSYDDRYSDAYRYDRDAYDYNTEDGLSADRERRDVARTEDRMRSFSGPSRRGATDLSRTDTRYDRDSTYQYGTRDYDYRYGTRDYTDYDTRYDTRDYSSRDTTRYDDDYRYGNRSYDTYDPRYGTRSYDTTRRGAATWDDDRDPRTRSWSNPAVRSSSDRWADRDSRYGTRDYTYDYDYDYDYGSRDTDQDAERHVFSSRTLRGATDMGQRDFDPERFDRNDVGSDNNP